MRESRRKFLRQACCSISTAGLAATLKPFGMMSALAQGGAADYKALVCVFLFGGNDGNNTVVPIENAEYNSYRTVRGGLALTQAELLPITAPSAGRQFGLHPRLPELQSLFSQGRAAVMCNVGTLVEPATRAQYQARSIERPLSLFSHSDQQLQWQASISDELSRTGWGGRMADRLAYANAGATVPMIVSVAGTQLFQTGSASNPLAIPSTGTFTYSGFTTSAANTARYNAMQELLTIDREPTLVRSAQDVSAQAAANSGLINPIITGTTSPVINLFAGQTSSISRQLLQVAKLIEARAALGVKRQIFFCSLGGFDTHNNQLYTQGQLFGQLAPALKSFYDATVQLGVAQQVTAFTLSDFGRTFKPASGGGTDHAWGSHHVVIGGAVRGGDFYGRFPTLALNGPDDVSDQGRWIPTTAVDQYAATLATWFGVSATDLPYVLPNINRFGSANLGFMG